MSDSRVDQAQALLQRTDVRPGCVVSLQTYSDFSREARSTWARLLKKVFKVDPLVCKCGARMQIISFITEPRVAGRILRHLVRILPACIPDAASLVKEIGANHD